MKRRHFITSGIACAAMGLAPASAFAGALKYRNGLVKKLLAEGKTVFVDFTTDWCPTCAAQRRTIDALKEENAQYEEHIVFVSVDFDKFRRSGISKKYRIPRRSTLLALKADQEIGRIVAGTSKDQIKNLLDAALDAS